MSLLQNSSLSTPFQRFLSLLSLLFVIFCCLYSSSLMGANHQEERLIEELIATRRLGPHFLLIALERGALCFAPTPCLPPTSCLDPARLYRGVGVMGHVWTLLVLDGQLVWHGGHSGEKSFDPPHYLDGFVSLGLEHRRALSLEGCSTRVRNPVLYLHHTRDDGYFEEGAGEHIPDLVVAFSLTRRQALQIKQVKERYDFTRYALMDHHCAHFALELLRPLKIELQPSFVQLPQAIELLGASWPLWEDAPYASCLQLSPKQVGEQLERCREAEEVTHLYRCYMQSEKKRRLRRPHRLRSSRLSLNLSLNRATNS